MPYEDYRTDLIELYYQNQLETLMSGYNPGQPTVILLPGIMGSQLMRTAKPYPASPNVPTEIVWMNIGILSNDALKLEIDVQGKDLDSFVIAAYGALRFGNQTPYNELRDLARTEDWNYAVFGFDWRRPLTESSGYFKTFVRDFRQRVIDAYGEDPLPKLTVVCHSMGGLVATDALRDQSFSGLGFRAVVTIGTPFYGSANLQNALFVGMPGILNTVYTAKVMVRLIASFPGAYSLMFLTKEIYDRDGQNLGLSRYPEYDPDGNVDVDPYDPDPFVMRRWPKDVKNHRQYLLDAKQQLVNIAAPINANVAAVFFNVRSSLDGTTAVEVSWNNVDGDDHIPGTTPLTGIPGDGDGTVPAWSAWHAYSRPKNRYELKQARVHGALLEHPEVLSLIRSIVKTGKLRSPAAPPSKAPSVASDKKIAEVVAHWAKNAKSRKLPPAELFQKSAQRAILTGIMNGPKPPMITGGTKRTKQPKKAGGSKR
jgi:pimeloyl-ACP methyl ester carboxylesterase